MVTAKRPPHQPPLSTQHNGNGHTHHRPPRAAGVSSSGGVGGDVARRYTRGAALAVVLLLLLGCSWTIWALARPLYWRLYSEVIHRYQPDAGFRSSGLQHASGGGGQQAAGAVLTRKGLIDSSSGTQQAADGSTQQADTSSSGGGSGADEFSIDLSKLSLEQLERLREKAREKQWEDEWWGQYMKFETDKKAALEKEYRAKEKATVVQHNITLTREAVHKLAKDGYLFVTWANHHYTDFAMSWVRRLQALGLTNFMVGAMDDDILTTLARRSIPTFSMQAGLTRGDFGWGSPTFAKMGRRKINLIATFLKLDVQVIISDVDVMWLRDPLPFFKRFPDADLLTSSDHLTPTIGGAEALERYPDAGSAFNIGIMLFRKRAAPFVDEWIKVIERDEKIWDQNAFNELIRKGQVLLPDDPHHYFKGDAGKLTVGILPVAHFASGHVFFVQRLHETLAIKPFAVHATFQFSGTPGKRHRFREAQLWDEKYEYFQKLDGFMSYEPHIPPELLAGAGPRTGKMDVDNTRGHFALVNHQLKELRTALALATVLNRTLILPPLWCGLDRYWAPHAGTLPGSTFKLPFLCPADHILDLEGGFARDWDEEEFGPNLDYREYSFLNSSQMPSQLRHSAVKVQVCAKGKGYCPEGNAPGTVDVDKVFLQENMRSDNIALTLSSVSHVQLLKFSTMRNAFGNFTLEADYTKFFKRMNQMGSVWCCVDAHPGHIHYDFWWDVPHVDKFGRQWTKWEPKTGP